MLTATSLPVPRTAVLSRLPWTIPFLKLLKMCRRIQKNTRSKVYLSGSPENLQRGILLERWWFGESRRCETKLWTSRTSTWFRGNCQFRRARRSMIKAHCQGRGLPPIWITTTLTRRFSATSKRPSSYPCSSWSWADIVEMMDKQLLNEVLRRRMKVRRWM
jgi:hypothetical protein